VKWYESDGLYIHRFRHERGGECGRGRRRKEEEEGAIKMANSVKVEVLIVQQQDA
jgi:hypothetical protein